MQHNTTYTIGFAAAVCVICSIFVAGSAVGLKDRQVANAILDKQKKVLVVTGMMQEGEKWPAEKITQTFDTNIIPKLINLKTGEYTDGDPRTFNQRKASKDLDQSSKATSNKAKVARVPNKALVYQVMKNNAVDMLVLPVEGKGLWSTLYGFIALDKDANTIRGLTFYEHGETPGLGGEVDNPRWKALWPGRKAFDAEGKPAISVIKGQAGPVAEAPHAVDGLSGATITSRGVGDLVQFWIGTQGFGPYLSKFKQKGS
jgi:Na+-transporting NADH:ubiquinone oxidoreductase subunit C